MKQQQKQQQKQIKSRGSNEGYTILGFVIFFLFVIGGFVAFLLSPSSSAKSSSFPPIRRG